MGSVGCSGSGFINREGITKYRLRNGIRICMKSKEVLVDADEQVPAVLVDVDTGMVVGVHTLHRLSPAACHAQFHPRARKGLIWHVGTGGFGYTTEFLMFSLMKV